MAGLRYAARKLLLQRTPACPPAVERRLVPKRLIHTGRPAFSPASVAQNSGTRKIPKIHISAPDSDTTRILKIQEELQQKKEELYNLLAVMERDRHYLPTGRVVIERLRNLKLLQNLSVEVDPKPCDPKWNFYRNTHFLNGFLICAASIVAVHYVRQMLDAGVKQVGHLKGKMISLGEQPIEGKSNADKQGSQDSDSESD